MFERIFERILCKILGHKSPKLTFETIFCGFTCLRCERFVDSKIDSTQSLIPYELWSMLMDLAKQ